MHWIDYGLSVLTRNEVAKRTKSRTIGDLADVMRDLSREGQLGAFEVHQRFYESGSPAGLRDLEKYLSENS
jgi:hypothetical protein